MVSMCWSDTARFPSSVAKSRRATRAAPNLTISPDTDGLAGAHPSRVGGAGRSRLRPVTCDLNLAGAETPCSALSARRLDACQVSPPAQAVIGQLLCRTRAPLPRFAPDPALGWSVHLAGRDDRTAAPRLLHCGAALQRPAPHLRGGVKSSRARAGTHDPSTDIMNGILPGVVSDPSGLTPFCNRVRSCGVGLAGFDTFRHCFCRTWADICAPTHSAGVARKRAPSSRKPSPGPQGRGPGYPGPADGGASRVSRAWRNWQTRQV